MNDRGCMTCHHVPFLLWSQRAAAAPNRLDFRPDVERPVGIENHILNFTHLFQEGVDNVDFVTMGEGPAIRTGDAAFESTSSRDRHVLRHAVASREPPISANGACLPTASA
jgi:hypothetical protein